MLSTEDTVKKKSNIASDLRTEFDGEDRKYIGYLHMFDECYHEKCPVLSSPDWGTGTGAGQKGLLKKVTFNRLDV